MRRCTTRTLPCCLLVLAWVTLHSPAQASDYHVALQSGLSINAPSLAVGFEGGLRTGDYGFLGKVDWNPWFSTQAPQDPFKAGVLNLGIGGEYLFFDQRCRTAMFLGTSTLLFETALDEAGSTGFFLEVTPVSIRWPVAEQITFRLDPASIHLVVPVLTGIPLISFQYRHSATLEWIF